MADNHRSFRRWVRLPLQIAAVPLLVFLPNSPSSFADARVACLSTEYCETNLRQGSRCVDGFCDNPYQYGCLKSQNNLDFEKQRVCHSEDPPGAAELGLCRDPTSGGLKYPEIRIMSQNWESPFFEAWILQILLSEIMDVPTTIETGVEGLNVNFYDSQARLEYGVSYDMDALERASQVGDCRKVEQTEGEAYKSCGHAILEIWSGQEDVIQELLGKGAVEPKSFIGVIGEEGWQVPKFTAEKDSSLLSHFGLTGEENRQKLAERFLQPTTWGDYCTEASPDGCLGDNNTVAVRPPESEVESNSFFVDQLYTGHFRKTELNDCDKWPKNCTGHFLDYPCGWSSFFIQQAHHLNIGLKSNGEQPGSKGYSYGNMIQIWLAANYTKSDVIGWWWRPEALYEQFQGTDFELQSVSLPPTNYKCVENRMNIEERCGDDDALRVGNREGSCDVPPIPNYKLLSTGLYNLVHDPSIPDPLRSPAYDVMKEFTIDGFILGQIFDYWFNSNGVDRYGVDPRDAVCRWVSENLEDLQRFIPRSYPREVKEEEEHISTKVAIGLGAFAVAATLASIVVTYRQRKRRVFQFAQVEFVFLLLVGMLFVSTTAIITVLAPTNSRCIATVWLLNLGYTLELVPLVVKIAAINRLMQAAMRMKRIKLSRTFLFGAVAALSGLVVVYMILWTVLDPPQKQGAYTFSDEGTEDGSTIVSLAYFCESGSSVWMSITVGAQAFLLLCASILAFLTRKMREDVNEANTISFLIYWNFVCVLLRVILLMLDVSGSIDSSLLNRSFSMVLSADSLATILIYFLPKFWAKEKKTGITFTDMHVLSVGLPQIIRSSKNETMAQAQGASSIYGSSTFSPQTFSKAKVSKVSFAGEVSYVVDTEPTACVSRHANRSSSGYNSGIMRSGGNNDDSSNHGKDDHELERGDSDSIVQGGDNSSSDNKDTETSSMEPPTGV